MREVKKRSGPRQAKPISPDLNLPPLSVDGCGKPHPNLDNAVRLLEDRDFSFDSFANKIYLGKEPLTESDILKSQRWLQQNALPKIGKDTVIDAIRYAALNRSFDPPQNYLEKLAWDGTPRLKTFWQTYYGAEMDPEYLAAIGPNWWISLVARILKPGCKVDTMPVLEGGQGLFKSTSLKIIGGEWFAENTQELGTKDFYLSIQGKILIEIGELDAFARADITTVKRILSCQCDNFRPPFGRLHEDFPRRSTFAGTTNKDDWARDDEERRFWPVLCKRIDLEGIARDRDQFFAEAKSLYDSGQSWWEIPGVAKEIQNSRHEEDPWDSPIEGWLNRNFWDQEITVAQVLSSAIELLPKDQGKSEQMRAAKILRKLGWIKEIGRVKGQLSRRWLRPDPVSRTVAEEPTSAF